MKKLILLSILLLSVSMAQAVEFDKFFYQKSLRFDYQRAGNSTTEYIFFDKLREEPYWGGNHKNLVDETMRGNHYVKLFDKASGELIYSKGYGSLFNEWQVMPEAFETSRSYAESVVVPYPRKAAVIELYTRDRKGNFNKKFSYDINPEATIIERPSYTMPVKEIHYSGMPQHCIDIVLIPEGYSEADRAAFDEAAKYFAEQLLSYSPFKEASDKFNIRSVWAPSSDSGVSIPGENQWNNTACAAKFNTFDQERYQMVDNYQRVCDIAGNAPYEIIYILSNTKKYGGGGIYNFYGISSAGHPTKTGKVYVHEFGHLFAGLADEYVGGTSANEFYPAGVEPWEANITTLSNFESKEWSKMLDKSTPVPTEAKDENRSLLGVYEGGGYVSEGVYRPWVNCLMNNLHHIDIFCPVCTQELQMRIDFHTEK